MKLAEVINRDQPLGLSAISADQELAAEVQDCLIRFGLLDPPMDGDFGTISDWALSEFCSFKGIPIAAGLTSRLARELLSASGKPLPINPKADLAAGSARPDGFGILDQPAPEMRQHCLCRRNEPGRNAE